MSIDNDMLNAHSMIDGQVDCMLGLPQISSDPHYIYGYGYEYEEGERASALQELIEQRGQNNVDL